MPTVEEGASTTPCHIAKRPKGLSALLTRAMETWSRCCPMAQHQRNGVKVRRPPPHSWGMCPLLLTPCIQGKPLHCAEACDADRMDRLDCNPPMAKTTAHPEDDGDNWSTPVAPPPSPVHRVERPRCCAQARDANCPIPNTHATATMPCHHHHTHQWEGTTSTPVRAMLSGFGGVQTISLAVED